MKNNLKLQSHKLRNLFNYRPLLYNVPKEKKSPVSDLFYYRNDKKFSTKFFLSNLSSHVYPEIKQRDNVKIIILSSSGKVIKNIFHTLMPFETKEINFFDQSIDSNFGSFCVFHNFEDDNILIKNNSHITERGYTGFSKDLKFWNFVHGNHNSTYLTKDNKIKSLMTESLFKKYYYPQLTFHQSDCFEIVLNNPSEKIQNFELTCFDKNKQQLNISKLKLNSFSTAFIPIENNDFSIKYISLNSNFYFTRPLIFKYYGEYFDVLHG